MTSQLPSQVQPPNPPRSVDILGMRVHDVTFAEAVALLRWQIASGRAGMVVTPNTEFAMRARCDLEFRQLLGSAGLAIPDGIGLVWASRLLGDPIREHVRGTDLVDKLAALGAAEGYRFFLLGAAEGVAAAAAARLQERHPGLRIAGTHSGSPQPAYDDEAAAVIRAAGRVDVLLVAYGAPAQERWIARNQPRLGVPVAIGVGGVFDFFSGRARRAPPWVRRLELEWLYRLVRQPSRWRRQLALPRFAVCVVGIWLRRVLVDRVVRRGRS